MNNLLNFLIKNSSWFVFIFYVIASCVLLFRNNPYQQSVYLTSANSATATVLKGYSNVTGYFGLRQVNDQLQNRNAQLEAEVIALKEQMGQLRLQLADSGIVATRNVTSPFSYVMARVISNSTTEPFNYITIDRGSADGIENEMGVVDHNGVVGVVNVVGKHAARVISLLNPDTRLSCKIRGSEHIGLLVWDAKSPRFARLQELPKHERYNKGDTIVTSGYSTFFPEGIIVGTVEYRIKDESDNFVSLRVRLASDFNHLTTVRAIKNARKPELDSIQWRDKTAESENLQHKDTPSQAR